MSKTVFIAYDFEIRGTLPSNLERVRKTPPRGFAVHCEAAQGAIWQDIVRPGIDRCDRFLAFLDKPNANVGFEIGYAIAMGKAAAWAQVSPTPHTWVEAPPFGGFMRARLQTPEDIRAAIAADEWVSIEDRPDDECDEALLLCPKTGGAALKEEVADLVAWRELDDDGWTLHDIPRLLDGVGLVVWAVAPHDDGEAERDGAENAALSVVAGYAAAQESIDLRILKSHEARDVVDISGTKQEFDSNADFRSKVESLLQDWWTHRAELEAPQPQPKEPPLEPVRPGIAPHPEDEWAEIPHQFIGRDVHLSDASAAIRGLQDRLDAGQSETQAGAVRVIWLHGFGGMGKSWFLHRVRLKAEQQETSAVSLIIDWDKPVWRNPLAGEPRVPAQVFETIATRLAQRLGPESADEYWLASAQVEACADSHRRAKQAFEDQLVLASHADSTPPDATLRSLLEQERLWHTEPAERRLRIDRAFREPSRYQDVFEAWCRQRGENRLAVCNPDSLRADGLRDALRRVTRSQPLLLLLDTAELLSPHLDFWLRSLLSPLLHEPLPVLVLVGSRLRPDIAQPDGSRHGWKAELGPGLRIVPFDDDVRLSVDEIEEALSRLVREPTTSDVTEVARSLHRVTRGIPLALRSILDLHEDGAAILESLPLTDDVDSPLDDVAAMNAVIATVCDRLLHHLVGRPERNEDLRDVIALALLLEADRDVLAALWKQAAYPRLRELGQRYSLLASGDLHPTVREILRAAWRDEDQRPDGFSDVLDDLEAAIASMPGGGSPQGTSEFARIQRLQANIQAWRMGDAAVGSLARGLALAMAWSERPEAFQQLISELPLDGPEMESERRVWKSSHAVDRPSATEDLDVARWLRSMSQRGGWTAVELASIDLVQGIAEAKGFTSAEKARACVGWLENAADTLGVDTMPRRQEAGEACFELTVSLFPPPKARTEWPDETERAYRLALRLGHETALQAHNFGVFLNSVKRDPAEAATSFERAIDLGMTHSAPHTGLGVVYTEAGRYKEAEMAFKRALEIEEEDASALTSLGYLYLETVRLAEAETALERALEVDSADPGALTGMGHVYVATERLEEAEGAFKRAEMADPKDDRPLNALGNLFLDVGRVEEAEDAFMRELELVPEDSAPHRGLAWLELLRRDNTEAAARHAEAAIRLDPNSPKTVLVDLAVRLWTEGWDAIHADLRSWLSADTHASPWAFRKRLALFLRKAKELGHAEDAARSFADFEQSEWCRPWSRAVAAWVEDAEPESLADKEAREILRDLTRSD